MTDQTREHADVQPVIKNPGTPDISYYTPKQVPISGSAIDPQSDGSAIPKLFQPLTIRGVTFHNRIWLSPLCQYSAEDGHHTAWHMTHLGGIIQRGPGLAFVEATSVTPQGRITPEDSGLWKDSQMEPLKRIVEFAHSQGQKIAIQLGHAGRKGSTVAPWLSSGDTAFAEANGWPDDVWAPSAIAYNDRHPTPHAYSTSDITSLKSAFVASIKRAITCGFDVIEIHNAHGYLLHEFLSPVSNKRTDNYGGSFENRTRLTLEIVDLARQNMPKDMPLFLRISATDWLEEVDGFPESWTPADTVKLAPILAEHGVDLLDVSTGGNHPSAHMHITPGAYQSQFARKVKAAVGSSLLVTSVGNIRSGRMAQELLEDSKDSRDEKDVKDSKGEDGKDGLDAVFSGRWFQKNPGLVWSMAEELGVEINVASQIRWAFKGRGGGKK